MGLGVILSGCGSSSPTADDPRLPDRFPDHSVDQIRQEILRTSDTLRAFSAKARISIRSPEKNQSFNAVVRQRRADSLFMRFSAFGIEGGRLLLTPDSVFFFDTRKGVLRTGPASAVRQIFPAPISSDELFESMLGLIAPDSSTQWSIQADSTFYYVSTDGSVSSASHKSRYLVDPIRWRVVRYVRQNADGTVLEKRHFSDFRFTEGILIPHRVVFRRPADDLSANVSYEEVNLNPSDLSFSLDVPARIPRRPFQ